MAPQLGYWDIQGLGQGVRMLLHYTNTKYEDTVYSIKNVNEWQAAKANNAWDLDFPNLPYYIDGDVKLTQSHAILRHLGRQHGLYGLDDNHASEIDMLLDTIKDIKMGIIVPNVFLRILDEKKKQEVIKSQDAKFKQISNYLGSKEFLMGNAITVADFELYDALVWHNKLDSKLISQYGNLMSYLARFENVPKVKSFMNGPYYMKNFFPEKITKTLHITN